MAESSKKDQFDTDIVTLTRHLIIEQQHHKQATGALTLLLSSIQLACKFTSSKVRQAGISNLYGLMGGQNSTGDDQKKLDVLANEVFVNSLISCHQCAILASEEDEKPLTIEVEKQGKYVVSFDPLDGSSNIDANVSIGSIFGIWKRLDEHQAPSVKDLLQSGSQMVCAGYCLYGSSTQIVLALGGKVNCYTLDPAIGEFILTHHNLRIPKKGAIYSCNEGNFSLWDPAIQEYVTRKKFPKEGQKAYSARYVGSMVADVHRTLLYGGIFLYPADKRSKTGKLRVLYEGCPMAFVLETAGGKAITGYSGRILDIIPTDIHERSGCILGSPEDVTEVESIIDEFKKKN